MKMKIIILILLTFVLSVPVIVAKDSECGNAAAWVKLNDSEWQDAGLTDISLDVYEPFKVKVTATTKVLCHVDVLLQGAGSTKTFEVIEGPCKYGDWIGEMDVPAGETRTYECTVRPTDNKFVGGYTPLNLKVQFTPPSIDDDNCQISFGLINPFINYTAWDGYIEDTNDDGNDNGGSNGGGSNDNGSPGFEIIIVLLAFSVIIMYRRKIKPKQ